MIQSVTNLYGASLAATDGSIGSIEDFYFDDQSFAVRYLVADTGSWLSGRLILLSPFAFGSFDQQRKELPVQLTRYQIEDSPPITRHQPITRQHEIDHFGHYGWPSYWEGSSLWGPSSYPVVIQAAPWGLTNQEKHHHREDRFLQSAKDIMGYEIHTTDGVIGTLADILIDDTQWLIKDFIIETGHWYSGKRIRLLPEHIQRIRSQDSVIVVNLTKKDLANTEAGAVAAHAT